MNPLSSLVLASLISVQPPILADEHAKSVHAPVLEAVVQGAEISPEVNADAVQAFVADAAARYAGN